MADPEDDDPADPEQDDKPEPPQRIFTLTEAERARQDLEPFLLEAISCRKKLSGIDDHFTAVSARIMMMGGVLVPYGVLAKLRAEHQQLSSTMKSSLEKILEKGWVVKENDVGVV